MGYKHLDNASFIRKAFDVNKNLSSKTWLQPLQTNKLYAFVVIAFVIIAMCANVTVRTTQLDKWEESSETAFFDGAPMFSTADAPYFLNLAADIINEKDGNDVPETSFLQKASNYFEQPLLSVLLALFSADDSPANLLKTGNRLVIVCSALTALMIAICFGASGHWIEGSIAGLGAGISGAYLARSSIGRIDADILNIGLLYLLVGLVICTAQANSFKSFCVRMGGCVGLSYIFLWWYPRPEFIVLASGMLGWLVFWRRKNLFLAAGASLLLLFCSNVSVFNPLDTVYLNSDVYSGKFKLPDTLDTVTELARLSPSQILISLAGSLELGIFCVAGLFLFCLRHPILGLGYSPLVCFVFLNFSVGNRVIFFASPMFWFGAGFLILALARLALHASTKTTPTKYSTQAVCILSGFLALTIAWLNSPTNYVPKPSFQIPVLKGLASLKNKDIRANSRVVAWWDYGYASMFLNGLPTLIYGGTHSTPSMHLVARSFLEPKQSMSIGILKFLSSEGNGGVSRHQTLASLDSSFAEYPNKRSDDLYLVLTQRTSDWMGSISKIGNWDIETGTPIFPESNQSKSEISYRPLNCRMLGYPKQIHCGGAVINLEAGLVNGKPILSNWAHTRDGTLLRRRNFKSDGDLVLQIVQNRNLLSFFLLHKQLFKSSYNELFYLGQVDHPALSLHYDDYPHIRIYKIEGEPAG